MPDADPASPSPAASTARADDDPAATWIAAAVLALLAAVFLARGLPWPETDDPFFVGTGIELARTGRLLNPLVVQFLDELGVHYFYVQPPLQAYTLAGWVHLFGIGTASFHAYAWTCYAAAGAGVLRLARRFGLSLAAGLLLVGIYLAAIVGTGLRPEAEAGALLFLGLALLDWDARFPQRLLALTLLGLSPLAYPLGLGIAVPFVVARWEHARPPGTPPARWLAASVRAWAPALAVAVALVVLLFLAMIRFDLGGFLAGYRAHLQYRRGYIAADGGVLHYFLVSVLEGGETVLTLPVVVGLAAAAGFVLWRWRRVPPAVRTLVLACAAAAVGCEVLYVVTAILWTVWLAFCALAALACALPTRAGRRAALVALTLLALWHHALGLLDLGGRRFPDPAALRAAAQAAARSSKPLVIDTSTWRYVFDYHVPTGTLDASLSAPLASLPPDRTWIIAPARSGAKCRLALPDFDNFPRESLGRHVFRSQPLCPDQPAVIP